ncbi:hypothetical protein ACKWTF_000884 [Chironomus riparius]
MWKIFLTVTWMISLVNSAQITCRMLGVSCTVINPAIVTQPNEVITVSGKPLDYVNSVLQLVKFENAINVAYVPTGVCKVFPKLSGLSINNTYSIKLFKDSFANCPHLTYIQIINGNYPLIPEGFAQSNSKLVYLAIEQTNTIKIDKGVFIGLNNLQYLDIIHNEIQCLPHDLFQNTPNLIKIDLSNNQITAIDQNLFKNLEFLYSVNLRFNMIKTLPSLVLPQTSMSALTNGLIFYFEMNQITSISPEICSILASRVQYTELNVALNPCIQTISNINLSYCGIQEFLKYLQNCHIQWSPTAYVPMQC